MPDHTPDRMPDHLLHAVAAQGTLMAVAASTRGVVEEARRRHDTWPTATAALGRALTGVLLLGALLKEERQRVMLELAGDGPLGLVVAEATATGEVRGYVQNPHTDLPRTPQGKLAVGEAVGKGTLWVVRDLGLREPYRSSVPLVSGEIAKDLAYYLARSEQTPSLVALGVSLESDGSVHNAGGLLLQALPGARDEELAGIEERARGMAAVTTQLDQGHGPEEMLHTLLGPLEFQVIAERPVYFRCGCSRERLAGALQSLGEQALKEIITEDGQAELVCRFCGEKYRFDRAELSELLHGLTGG